VFLLDKLLFLDAGIPPFCPAATAAAAASAFSTAAARSLVILASLAECR